MGRRRSSHGLDAVRVAEGLHLVELPMMAAVTTDQIPLCQGSRRQ
jgi:hypothetical protein